MILVLEGEIKTPIVTHNTEFIVDGCKATIIQPRRRWYNKINAGKPMYPYSFKAYLGKIQLRRKIRSKRIAQRVLAQLLKIEALGRYTNEGMGRIEWVSGEVFLTWQGVSASRKKVKIRKGSQ
ncbi:MAG: hypothetical protein ACE5OZ_22580 [Candidatus Heimdallarchaeota archaeon]